jgi:sugar phosphate permease
MATYAKIIRRLIPFLLICYIVAMIDRLNIGYAKLEFLKDLHLNEAIFGLAAGIFYVGYVLFEVPSNLLLERRGIRWVLLRIMMMWGLVTMALALADNATHFYILRFLLGVAEAGFFPGILLYLTFWFPDRLRGRVTSAFATALPIAGIIAGPLSGTIMSRLADVGGLRGWQWLFLLEGLPAVLLGIIAFFYLADRPEKASWLSADEKRQVAADLAGDRSAARVRTKLRFSEALRDSRLYLLAVIYFAYFCSLNAVLLWIPTLLRSVGIASVSDIGWISGGISLVATCGMLIMGYSSDRLRERRLHVVCAGMATGCAFLCLSLAQHSSLATILLLTVAATGVYSVLALFWTIPSSYLEGNAAAGGLATISAVGSFGGAVSPAFIGWARELTGSFYMALGAVGLLVMAGMALLLIAFREPRPKTAMALAT